LADHVPQFGPESLQALDFPFDSDEVGAGNAVRLSAVAARLVRQLQQGAHVFQFEAEAARAV
jgi:hypothetical protein